MDGLLRSHQADTTARRLQLERALSQRQAELRARTQEMEELSAGRSEDRKVRPHTQVFGTEWNGDLGMRPASIPSVPLPDR